MALSSHRSPHWICETHAHTHCTILSHMHVVRRGVHCSCQICLERKNEKEKFSTHPFVTFRVLYVCQWLKNHSRDTLTIYSACLTHFHNNLTYSAPSSHSEEGGGREEGRRKEKEEEGGRRTSLYVTQTFPWTRSVQKLGQGGRGRRK